MSGKIILFLNKVFFLNPSFYINENELIEESFLNSFIKFDSTIRLTKKGEEIIFDKKYKAINNFIGACNVMGYDMNFVFAFLSNKNLEEFALNLNVMKEIEQFIIVQNKKRSLV